MQQDDPAPHPNDEQDFQVLAQDHSASPEDLYFDQVVAALQEIVFGEAFEAAQSKFMRLHCAVFEEGEENKNQYMAVFNLYHDSIEKHVQQQLHRLVADFDMGRFSGLLESRHHQIDETILDMLESFSDFEVFKKLMLEFKGYLSQEETLKQLTVKSHKIG